MNRDWILILTKNKEQYSGIESIGSVVTEEDKTDQSSTPMDDAEGKTDNTTPESKDQKEPETDTAEPEPDATDTTDSEIDFGDSTSDDSEMDNNSDMDQNQDAELIPAPTDSMDDPNIAENRRILLSDKLIELYRSIRNSIDDINESNSFKNKPVIIKKLNRLSEIVTAVNKSVNVVNDYKIVLLKYTMCVKIYNEILNEI